MRPILLALGLGLALVACAPARTELRLEAPAAARSAVTTLELDGALAAVHAVDLGPPALGLPLLPEVEADTVVLSAAFYSVSARSLGVDPGVLDLDQDIETISLPPTPMVGRRRVVGAESGAWETLDFIPEPLASVRLPERPPVACLDQGGCLDSAQPTGCSIPCPEHAAVAEPEPPAPPEPVRTSCPAGWSEAPGEDGAPASCTPWLNDVPPSCASDEMLLPGGCAALGPPCPSGEFAEDLPSGGVLYVRPSTTSGDGSIDSPFATFAEALAVGRDGDVIALSRGDHPVNTRVSVNRDLRIVGVCAAATSLVRGASASTTFVVSSTAAVEGLRTDFGLTALDTAVLELAHLRIEDTGGDGVRSRGRLIAHDLVVERPGSYGIVILAGRATIERAVVANATNAAFYARSATVSLARLVLLDPGERGLEVSGPAVIEAREIAILGAHDRSVSFDQARSDAEHRARGKIEDLFVDRAEPRVEWRGWALAVRNGAQLEVERARLVRSRAQAVHLTEDGALTLRDAVIDQVRTATIFASDDAWLTALVARRRARATLERVFLRAPESSAMFLENASVSATDLTIIGTTQPGATAYNLESHGIDAETTDLELRRVSIERVGYAAIYVHAGRAALTDIAIRGVLEQRPRGEARAPDFSGYGAQIVGATATIERFQVEDSQQQALSVETASVTVQDLIARNLTAGDTYPGGVVAVRGLGRLTLRRAYISRGRYAGLEADGDSKPGTLEATDVTIDRTDLAYTGGYGDLDRAAGVIARCGATISLQRFSITSSFIYGLHLQEGMARLKDGVIRGQQVGVALELIDPPPLDAVIQQVEVQESSRNTLEHVRPSPLGVSCST
ncbi:MAG: hypothetical protein IT384_18160 [Deltaproteobacteria bacterium]|nr:hypothetical protein [Deltaproteobacteria bacterium]